MGAIANTVYIASPYTALLYSTAGPECPVLIQDTLRTLVYVNHISYKVRKEKSDS